MKKIIPFKQSSLWGNEVWLNSMIIGKETKFEDGELCTEGPLIKIIRITKDLPLQVHPDDEMAQIVENKLRGQSKFWYILDAPRGSSLVVGLEEHNNDAILKKHHAAWLKDIFRKTKLHKHDFINLPAGIIYGKGAGIKALEVSQQSEIAFHLHDFQAEENLKNPLKINFEKVMQARRDVSHQIDPKVACPLTFETPIGSIAFPTTITHVSKKALVVDLVKEAAYLVEDELIDFDKFAIIYI